MTHDEVVSCHGSVNIADNWLVTFGWSEIMGSYNTADTTVEDRESKSWKIICTKTAVDTGTERVKWMPRLAIKIALQCAQYPLTIRLLQLDMTRLKQKFLACHCTMSKATYMKCAPLTKQMSCRGLFQYFQLHINFWCHMQQMYRISNAVNKTQHYLF